MDALVRIELRPLGPWTTPWQADSLAGALACGWARSHGEQALRRDFLEPWLGGEPLFAISDAFPGDALPAPASLPLWNWPDGRRKAVKKIRWVTKSDFMAIQRGSMPRLDKTPDVAIRDRVRLRNAVSRISGSAGDGGELFENPHSSLSRPDASLTLYARGGEDGLALLVEALNTLGQTGFGADASVGHGSFELAAGPQPCPELDDVPEADAFVSLSTFQPAAGDPTEGFWRLFVKYGKLAPEFHDVALHKRPQVMFEPGACFRTGAPPRPFYGTAIGPERLLSEPARRALAVRGVHPVQAAFALAVPMRWPSEVTP